MSRVSLGIAIILWGIILLMGEFNVIPMDVAIGYYVPAIFMFIGIANVAETRKISFFNSIIFLIGVALVLQKAGIYNNLNIWNIFWPVVLVLIGIKFVTPSSKSKNTRAERDEVIDVEGTFDERDNKSGSIKNNDGGKA